MSEVKEKSKPLFLNIKVLDEHNHEVLVKMRPKSAFKKLIEGYCEQEGKVVEAVSLLYNGVRVNAADNPQKLEMTDGAILHVPPPPRKKGQPFYKPSAEQKKIINKNQECAILKFPKELKDKIWAYAIGNETIHIRGYSYRRGFNLEDQTRKLYHIICQAKCSETAAYHLSKTKPEDPYMRTRDMRVTEVRHYACVDEMVAMDKARRNAGYNLPFNHSPPCENAKKFALAKLASLRRDNLMQGLGLLQTCRQIYVEANPILWQTSKWSFITEKSYEICYNKPMPVTEVTRLFFNKRTAHQRSLLQHVYIDCDKDDIRWFPLTSSIRRKFDTTSLKCLQITMPAKRLRSGKEEFTRNTSDFMFIAEQVQVIQDHSDKRGKMTWEEKYESFMAYQQLLKDNIAKRIEHLAQKSKPKKKAKTTKKRNLEEDDDEEHTADGDLAQKSKLTKKAKTTKKRSLEENDDEEHTADGDTKEAKKMKMN